RIPCRGALRAPADRRKPCISGTQPPALRARAARPYGAARQSADSKHCENILRCIEGIQYAPAARGNDRIARPIRLLEDDMISALPGQMIADRKPWPSRSSPIRIGSCGAGRLLRAPRNTASDVID